MNTISRILITMCLSLTAWVARAQSSHWTVDIYQYQYDMTVYATIATGDEVVASLDDYEIAAFVGDECRGVGTVQTVQNGDHSASYCYLRVRSNQSSGEVVSFRVYCAATGGEYHVAEPTVTFASQQVEGMPSSPLVLPLPAVELDEAGTAAPAAAGGTDVTVRRTIAAGEWSTLCLPFAMTAAQVTQAFGADARLAVFDGYDLLDDDVISVRFTTATSVEANRPCLVRVSQAVSTFSLQGVAVAPEAQPQVNLGTDAQPKAMVGTYVSGTTVPAGSLFISGNQFWYSVGLTQMQAFRAYFTFADVLPGFSSQSSPARVLLVVDGVATAIVAPAAAPAQSLPYTLGGQPATSATKGITIVNGKKILKN